MRLLPLLLTPTLALSLGFTYTPTSEQQSALNPSENDDLAIPGANPLKFCEDPQTYHHILQIKNVDLDPNPPEKGETLHISATGNFTETVEKGAYVNIVVKLGLITILRRREDLCEQMKQVDKECPLEPGETTVQRDVDLPSVIPPGKFVVTADVFTKDDEKITCLKTEISFSSQSGMAQKLMDSIDL